MHYLLNYRIEHCIQTVQVVFTVEPQCVTVLFCHEYKLLIFCERTSRMLTVCPIWLSSYWLADLLIKFIIITLTLMVEAEPVSEMLVFNSALMQLIV
jgi:hypothetical protein